MLYPPRLGDNFVPGTGHSSIRDLYPLDAPGSTALDRDSGSRLMKMLGDQADECFIGLAVNRGSPDLRQPGSIIQLDEFAGFCVGFYLDLNRFHRCYHPR